MEKRILYELGIFVLFVIITFIFPNKLMAYEYYNSEISYYENDNGGITVVKANYDVTDVTIPEKINGKPVNAIGTFGFSNCDKLKSINIPETVETIGAGAFEHCRLLEDINIPKGVTEIDSNTFQNCESIKNLSLENITTIGPAAFKGCINLNNVVISENLEKLYDESFKNCISLKQINLPYGLSYIGAEAFYNSGLTSIVIPSSVTTMTCYDGTFENCYELKNAVVNAELATIPARLFKNCISLTDIIFPNESTITTCGESAFENCTALENIKLPPQLATILESSFDGCSSLKMVKMPNTLKSILNYAFKNCISLSEVYFPNTINEISDKAFDDLTFDKIVFYGYKGTVVEKYASEHGIKFMPYSFNTFEDVKNVDWYYNAVKYVYEHKIMSGINSSTFAPDQKLTRGMIVTMLYNMENHPSVKGTSKFADVQNKNVYFYNAVVWASNNNVVSGYANGKFGPDVNITREQLATILYNYCRYKGKYKTVYADYSKFIDSNKISSFAKWGMNWAVGNKIVNGSNGKLNPQGTATRAEAVAMISNYCNTIK